MIGEPEDFVAAGLTIGCDELPEVADAELKKGSEVDDPVVVFDAAPELGEDEFWGAAAPDWRATRCS